MNSINLQLKPKVHNMEIQSTKQETPKFTPVKLTIIFDTEEELQSFVSMCGRDVTVADLLKEQVECRGNQYVSKQTLRKILGTCYSHLLPFIEKP